MTLLQPSPENTIAILLGASTWPEVKQFDDEAKTAFSNSAQDIRDYFLSKKGLGIPEENLCDLFDSEESADDIDREVGRFIKDRIDTALENKSTVTDLFFYFIGHADFTDDEDYFLAIKRTRDDNKVTSSLAIKSIAKTLKEKARFVRRYIILDCCYSGSAISDFQSGPAEFGIRQTVKAFEEKKAIDAKGDSSHSVGLPSRGTLLLCSSRHNKRSKLNPEKTHTIFTKAVTDVLVKGNPDFGSHLSFQDLHECLEKALRSHADNAPRPEIHIPDQIEGDISTIPLFKNACFSGQSNLSEVENHIKFLPLEDRIQCYVVVSESERDPHTGQSLASLVRNALKTYEGRINKITSKPLDCQPTTHHITQIFSSMENYENSLVALCRSEVVIFDLTNYEPAVMLLLGIRSVARRGVTISSFGGDYVIGEPFDFPFNIKDVNIISHSKKQIENQSFEEGDPIRLIGSRLVEGFRQIIDFPSYLDLPSFDSVRRVPAFEWDRSVKDYDEQVLVLCPFGKDYRSNNWKNHIRRHLGFVLEGRIDARPNLVRTLDMKSPRLVSQTLYEAIRLTSMCIVDWTEWKPNIFYELGVRIACNEISPVCIIEDKYYTSIMDIDKSSEEKKNERITSFYEGRHSNVFMTVSQQCKSLLEFFGPIIYRAPQQEGGDDPDEEAFNKMVLKYESLVGKTSSKQQFPDSRLEPGFTYGIISAWIDPISEFPSTPVHKDLMNSAELLSSPEVDSEGRSPVLYPKNSSLLNIAETKAFEWRLAAWYYLSNRYTVEQILDDEGLRNDYLFLGNITASHLQRSANETDRNTALEIREKVKQIRDRFKRISSPEGGA